MFIGPRSFLLATAAVSLGITFASLANAAPTIQKTTNSPLMIEISSLQTPSFAPANPELNLNQKSREALENRIKKPEKKAVETSSGKGAPGFGNPIIEKPIGQLPPVPVLPDPGPEPIDPPEEKLPPIGVDPPQDKFPPIGIDPPVDRAPPIGRLPPPTLSPPGPEPIDPPRDAPKIPEIE